MPDKSVRMVRAGGGCRPTRPVMLAIAGDSAAGKTTLTRGLVEALGAGPDCVSICVDDYHRYDRAGAARPAVHRAAPGLQPRRHHGAAPAAAGQRAAHPQAGLRPLDGRAGPTGARRAQPVRDRRGPAPAAQQARPRLLRRHGVPRPARGHPPRVEARRATPPRGATRRSRCSPSSTGASPSRRRSSARSAATPTSSCGSARSPSGTTRRARRSPPSSCCARRSATPTCAVCSASGRSDAPEALPRHRRQAGRDPARARLRRRSRRAARCRRRSGRCSTSRATCPESLGVLGVGRAQRAAGDHPAAAALPPPGELLTRTLPAQRHRTDGRLHRRHDDHRGSAALTDTPCTTSTPTTSTEAPGRIGRHELTWRLIHGRTARAIRLRPCRRRGAALADALADPERPVSPGDGRDPPLSGVSRRRLGRSDHAEDDREDGELQRDGTKWCSRSTACRASGGAGWPKP